MGKQGAEFRWWDQSSSSTVLLDPAALLESCKQQIQGKDGIPAERQRLIFACPVANQEVLSYTCKPSSTRLGTEENGVSEFLKELGGWKAILKDDNHNIAKLLHPVVEPEEQVAAEDERKASQLSCETARELRSMGIPCNVYYLFFSKWIPADGSANGCEVTSGVDIQIDKEFQSRSFKILLFGRLNGSNLPVPFVYRMNGGEVARDLIMQEQMAEYIWRHRLGLSAQSVGKGVEGRDVDAVVETDGLGYGFDKSAPVDDYYCPCGKDRDFNVLISKDRQRKYIRSFVLKVIQVPADAGRKKPEQSASHVPGRCERGNSNAKRDSNKFCVSSTVATSRKSENTVSEGKATVAQSLSTKWFQCSRNSPETTQEGGDPSASCTLEAATGPSKSSESSTSDRSVSPQNVSTSSTEEDGAQGLPIVEEPLVKLSKKKKKKRKGKRSGKPAGESSSSTASKSSDSVPAVSTFDGSVDFCTPVAMVECQCGSRESTCCSGISSDGTDAKTRDSPLIEDIVRELSTCGGEKGEAGLVNIFRREVHCSEDRGGSTIRAESKKIGQGYLTAEEVIAEIVSDKKVIAFSKEESSKAKSFGTNSVPRPHGGEFLPIGRDIPSSTCLCTGPCDVSTDFRDPHAVRANVDNNAYMCSSICPANNVVVSQPFVGPIMVEMGFQKSAPSSGRSPGDSPGSHYPSRDLFGNLDAVSDDAHFSARGGYNGSGAGSRNGRNAADGSSGNRNHGRGGSEDNRKGSSGYNGGGQGSSGSNHGTGPGGGSTTSGSSGGSGGGNGNRGGGRGSSNGGSWDGRRPDDDNGNGNNKDRDNDERYRNSFQASSNGESATDSLPRKKGISSLDNRGSHGKKEFSGGGSDQLMNGSTSSSSSHGSHATSSSGGKENLNSWQKGQNQDEWTDDSVPPSQSTTGSEEGAPRTRADQKNGPPSTYMNGLLQHETKGSNVAVRRDGADPYPHVRATHITDSFANALKQNLSVGDHVSTSSSRGLKETRNAGTVPGIVPWQTKKSWDDQQPSYNNRHASEVPSQVGPSKGKMALVKPPRNGIQMRGQFSSDNETVSHTKSPSAPSTPNGSQANMTDFSQLTKNDSMRTTDGHIYQSSVPSVPSATVASELVTQFRMPVVNTVAVRQPGEVRSFPEEAAAQRPAWGGKPRKSSGDQERSQVRDKPVGDRDRTTTQQHYAQKWVQKGAGTPSTSSANVRSPADGTITESHESQHDIVHSKEVTISEEDIRRDDVVPITSPSQSVRRLQTEPSGSTNATSRVSHSEAELVEEPRESAAIVAGERPAGHHEQAANLRGLLPRERIVDNSSTKVATTQSTAGGYSTPVQSPIPGEQQQIKLRLDTRLGKGSTTVVKPVLSPAAEETRRAVREILDAVQSSCRDRRAAEVIVREVGRPMAEFEKVLGALAPSVFPVSDSSLPTSVLSDKESLSGGDRGAIRSRENSTSSQTCEADEFSLCRCRVLHIPLKSIWEWYEKPSYYGAEVNAVESQRRQRNGEEEEEPFLAYFVPYLSGLQIFGHSPDMDASPSAQPKEFSRSDMLATLLPSPGKSDESSSHHGGPTCATSGSRYNAGKDCGTELLYEFYDADQPQMRKPLFLKVEDLVQGVSSSNSYSRGDSAVLDRLCLGDIHPASWFAVAWYPIYRIPEGTLKAVFLTYHSFDHFAPHSSLSRVTGGATDVDNSISMPVVGLECYNPQVEPWLLMEGSFSKEAAKVSERLTLNPIECLEKRISSLREVAAGMAKGIQDGKSTSSADGSSANKFRHSDYEFFVKRRR